MVRGGHIDLTVLGALQVDAGGQPRELDDPRQDGQGHGRRDGSGRRREEASSSRWSTRRKDGGHKILKRCTLPFTGLKVVNLIVTELAVIEVTPRGLVLREIASDTTLDNVRAATGATLIVDGPPARF